VVAGQTYEEFLEPGIRERPDAEVARLILNTSREFRHSV